MRHPSGISNTCPDIDYIIKQIKYCMKEATAAEKYDESSDKNDSFKSIENELSGLERLLEDLRTANSALREWGESEMDRANKAENDLYELEEKLEAQS